MAKILAFESFDGGSHKQFRQTMTKYSTHNWTWITRPPCDWKWRMLIGAQELVEDAIRKNCFKNAPDFIFSTSLIDVAALRTTLPKGARDIPIILYMHENQIAYPTHDKRDATFAITNLQSVLAADKVIFNSKWNMDSFLEGISALLKHVPNHTLGDIQKRIRENAAVSWVPVEMPPDAVQISANNDDAIKIVWPHRWEHDKGPEKLLAIAREWSNKLNLRWTILGEQFQKIPEPLEKFKAEFKERIDHMGFVESKEEYWKLLHQGDWVLSTASHEFFGIAVVEALFAGCLPWVPEALSYRELLPAAARGISPIKGLNDGLNRNEMHCRIMEHLHMAQADNAVPRLDLLISS